MQEVYNRLHLGSLRRVHSIDTDKCVKLNLGFELFDFSNR